MARQVKRTLPRARRPLSLLFPSRFSFLVRCIWCWCLSSVCRCVPTFLPRLSPTPCAQLYCIFRRGSWDGNGEGEEGEGDERQGRDLAVADGRRRAACQRGGGAQSSKTLPPPRAVEGGRAVNDVVSCLPERRATSISRRRRLFARSFVVAVAMITYRGGLATAASGRCDNDGVKKLLSDACSANAVRPYIFLRGIFLYMTTDGSFGAER